MPSDILLLIENAASGYGAVLYGGNENSRQDVIDSIAPSDALSVDCRQCNSAEDIAAKIAERVLPDAEDLHIAQTSLLRLLKSQERSIVLEEFDRLPKDEQTTIAQTLKGLAEQQGYDENIYYSASEPDAVIKAEPDLRMRVQSFLIEEVKSDLPADTD